MSSIFKYHKTQKNKEDLNFTTEIYGFFNLSDQQQSTNMEYSINLFNNITNKKASNQSLRLFCCKQKTNARKRHTEFNFN